ncbi:GTP 3',8-cyclase MoaA [Candidatus Bipolaricaulota bacterium]|nr:GTP 3',8-cyclase MoaA [Candidatus Bipolaricaulota bacterium]
MIDGQGRTIRYLRLSVTDRCNLSCVYCRSAACNEAPREDLLSFEEIVQAVRIACELGIDRVRITGGEPLVRRGISGLIRMLREGCPIADLSLSTNGLRLAELAGELKRAGLDRVNVSLDSLSPDRFRRITRGGDLGEVLAGIEAAQEAGLAPVKLNTVAMRGINDEELVELALFALDRGLTIRFIELMPVGEAVASGLWPAAHLPVPEVRRLLAAELPLLPAEAAPGNGPARYFRVEGYPGAIGFIAPLSEPFCADCNRIRLTAAGELRPCLAHDHGLSLREPLRKGNEVTVRKLFLQAVNTKPSGHGWGESQETTTPMADLGG